MRPGFLIDAGTLPPKPLDSANAVKMGVTADNRQAMLTGQGSDPKVVRWNRGAGALELGA